MKPTRLYIGATVCIAMAIGLLDTSYAAASLALWFIGWASE